MGIFSFLHGLVWDRFPNMLPDPKSIGEWTLFANPSPFTRFVTLRCPSIDFSESEFLKFVKGDGDYVKLTGRMIENDCYEGDIVYKRLIVRTDDGGALALDFPDNLELEEEFSFDCPILIIPGTVEGSHQRKIKSLVSYCLEKNFFPVVMNPRGCADSPLITPRLFTAGDSNDISKALQYIIMKRPSTKLMAVGCEYGANMLTKYLAESGNRTPLLAAICINNPFDLVEATSSTSVYQDFNRSQQMA